MPDLLLRYEARVNALKASSWSIHVKLGTLILNVTLINWRLFREELPDGSQGLMMIMILDF